MCVLQSVHDVCRTGVIYLWCDIFVCAATQPVRMLVRGRWYRDGSCQVESEAFDAPPVAMVTVRFPGCYLMLVTILFGKHLDRRCQLVVFCWRGGS